MAVVNERAAIPIVDNIASLFSLIVIRGIQDYLQQLNYFSIVINADFDSSEDALAVQEMISRSGGRTPGSPGPPTDCLY